MSFPIVLGYTESPHNKVNKVFHEWHSLTGELRGSSSIITPTILIRQTSDMTIGNESQPLSKCNYMFINNFNRYYYITDIISVRNSAVEIHGRVDVLKTYADEIYDNSGYILRSASRSNVSRYLDDDHIKIYANPHIVTKKLTGDTFAENPTFILAVSGGGSSSSTE